MYVMNESMSKKCNDVLVYDRPVVQAARNASVHTVGYLSKNTIYYCPPPKICEKKWVLRPVLFCFYRDFRQVRRENKSTKGDYR